MGIPWLLALAIAPCLVTAIPPLTPEQASDPRTALLYSARRGDAATVQALLAAGVDANTKSGDGTTALMHAARGNTATVQVLLAAGADVNAKADNGKTALMDAAEDGRAATLQALLSAAQR